MRISEEMAQSLVDLARLHIDENARVWLFGSRARDEARGGDIDIMIEALGIQSPLQRKINFRLAFEDIWGEQKLDIVLHDTTRDDQPIHEIARREGILLGQDGFCPNR